MPKNTALTLLILLFSFSILTGCSQYGNYFKYSHAGNYELIDLGKLDNTPNSYHIYNVHNKIIHAAPNVSDPSVFTMFLLEHTDIYDGETVLEIGTGTGVQAIFAAEKAKHVLAMDINPNAIENTLYNARRFGLSEKISVRKSDIFNALKPDEKFDVIICNIPFPGSPLSYGNWELHERFFRDAGKHLNNNGRIYFSTGVLDNMPRTKAMAEENGLKIIRVDMGYTRTTDVEHVIYVFKHEKYAKWLAKDLGE